jgi:hypothetical protein
MSSVSGPGGPPKPPITSGVQSTDSAPKNEETKKTAENSSTSSSPTQTTDSMKITEHRLDGYMVGVKLNAQAEREMPPLSPNKPVDITDRDWRNHMLRQAPQVNDVSMKAGNAYHICGGAAMSNALIMSSKTPEQAKANARAVRDLAGSLDPKVQLSKEEDQALKNMESEKPKMSAVDAQHLQQVMYRIGQRMPLASKNPEGTGLSTTQVGCAMNMLKARGAFEGSNVTMHCNRNTFKDDQGKEGTIDHWTVTVDGNFANSQVVPGNRSIVQGGPPPDRAKGTKDWQNEITINGYEKPPTMYLQFKQPENKANEYQEAVIDVSKYKDPNDMLSFENEVRKAAKAPPQTM